jgi:tellurite resistance protein TehA-like permease
MIWAMIWALWPSPQPGRTSLSTTLSPIGAGMQGATTRKTDQLQRGSSA